MRYVHRAWVVQSRFRSSVTRRPLSIVFDEQVASGAGGAGTGREEEEELTEKEEEEAEEEEEQEWTEEEEEEEEADQEQEEIDQDEVEQVSQGMMKVLHLLSIIPGVALTPCYLSF